MVLSIVGAFGVLALSINAFFLRGIYGDLNTVKIQMARAFERSDAKEKRIEVLELTQKEIIDRLTMVEREVVR